jgi:tRNA(Ile)-lysidine synthase
VSSGADSVAMAHLFHRAGLSFAIAHVNYGLRGNDSIADMEFVRNMAQNMGVAFHLHQAELDATEKQNKGLQALARDVRYAFFADCIFREKYSCAATAHQRDDRLEHFFLYTQRRNIPGALRGIPVQSKPRNGLFVIRPMLFATGAEIREWLTAEGISWREDRSNSEATYQRNRIRNRVIPAIEESLPGFRHDMDALLVYAEKLQSFAEAQFPELEHLWVQDTPDNARSIDRDALLRHPLGDLWLQQYLRTFGFHPEQCLDILAAGNKAGLAFNSSSAYKLYTHNQGWTLTDKEVHTIPEGWLAEDQPLYETSTYKLRLSVNHTDTIVQPYSPVYMVFDITALQFPLRVRAAQPGDKVALEKGGHALVSDILNEARIPRHRRGEIALLCSGEQVIAIPGLRRSALAKVDKETASRAVITLETQAGNPYFPEPNHGVSDS